MSSSASSNLTEVAINVVFGIIATIISIVTVWQGHKAWKIWHGHTSHQDDVAQDLELGLQSSVPTPASLEVPDQVVASSAPSSDQDEEAAQSTNVPVRVHSPEPQPALPMTVDAVPSTSPDSVHEAWDESNEIPGGHVENEHPGPRDMEPYQLHAPSNDEI